MKFKYVIKEVYFELMDLKDEWLLITSKPKKDLFINYIMKLLIALSPIIPHWTDIVWRTKLYPYCIENNIKCAESIYNNDDTKCVIWNNTSYDKIKKRKRIILHKTLATMRSMYDVVKKKNPNVKNACIIIANE